MGIQIKLKTDIWKDTDRMKRKLEIIAFIGFFVTGINAWITLAYKSWIVFGLNILCMVVLLMIILSKRQYEKEEHLRNLNDGNKTKKSTK